MKIAILSDIHDRLDYLALGLAAVSEDDAGRLFFLGDFCAPFSLKALAEGFGGPIDVVFGNNDGDVYLLSAMAAQYEHVTLHGIYAEPEVDGRRFALFHYPEVARRLAECGAFAAVFSGHDHQRYAHRIGSTLWANPGEVMGRDGAPSVGFYETSTAEFRHRILDGNP